MISRYRLLVKGKNPDYFIQKLIRRKINIYEVKKQAREVILVIDQSDYEEIEKIKTIYEIQIVGRIGLAKYTYWLSRYAVFICFFLVGVFLNLLLSCIIFDVEVVHSNQYIRELVQKDLEEAGIRRFRFKVSYQRKEEIIERLLKKETDDLEWLEIEEVGTKYVVKVEQRKKNKDKPICNEQNIIAKKDAMILEIQAESGEIVKKKLDYVKKGDVIISGLIYNKEHVVSKRCAIGKVYGEVWYRVTISLPKQYVYENVTGRRKRQLEIRFLNSTYSFFHHFKTYQKKEFSILQSLLLPIQFNFVEYLETTVKKENYTLSNVDQDAIIKAVSKLENRLQEGDEILSKNVLKKEEKESKIIVEVFLKVKEDITDTEDISNINIEELN